MPQIPLHNTRLTCSQLGFGFGTSRLHHLREASRPPRLIRTAGIFTEGSGIASLYERNTWSDPLVTSGDLYHPSGTLRMGSGPATGVVDADLRTFAVPNLRVLSTAAFPNGGSANPSMMLALLGLRLVDDLVGSRKHSVAPMLKSA